MYHNFFIHSSVSGHLGCFHVLAIVNSAAITTEVHFYFSVLIPWQYAPVMGLLGHMEVLFLVFKRNLHTVLHSGCISFIPTDSARGLSHFSLNHVCSFTVCSVFFSWINKHKIEFKLFWSCTYVLSTKLYILFVIFLILAWLNTMFSFCEIQRWLESNGDDFDDEDVML